MLDDSLSRLLLDITRKSCDCCILLKWRSPSDSLEDRLENLLTCLMRHLFLFSLGLYGQRWINTMELWHDWVLQLIALKPHKRLYFQRGFYALSLLQQGI